MFYTVLASAAAVLIPLSTAFPTILPRSLGPSCSKYGNAGFDQMQNFTLTALNTTLPNANSTGAPLIVADIQSVYGYTTSVLATWNSYSYGSGFTSLTLQNGGIIANGDIPTPCTGTGVSASGVIDFITNYQGAQANPVEVFCGVADTDPAYGASPQLAMNGSTSSFSLCEIWENGPNAVVFNATSDSTSYRAETCYPVVLQILQQDD